MPVSKENTIHDQPWPNLGRIGPNVPNDIFTRRKKLFSKIQAETNEYKMWISKINDLAKFQSVLTKIGTKG